MMVVVVTVYHKKCEFVSDNDSRKIVTDLNNGLF